MDGSHRFLAAVSLAMVVAGGCGGGDSEPGAGSVAAAVTPPPARTSSGVEAAPSVERLVVDAPSLAGNLLGDPAELEVAVQLPGSYGSTDRRYPVVYVLAGYGEDASVAPVGAALGDLAATGEAPEMIVVAISGVNAFGGSFYVDSPVTGNWAQAIYVDVVAAIDTTYRTLPARDSRGIAGFSMGGFGALDLAMRHPDVFGAVYALSPGLFDPSGLAESQMFADPVTIEQFLAGQRELADLPDEQADEELLRAMGRSADVRFSAAYGMAFAPDPDAGPPYVDYPYTEATGPVDEAIWRRWEAGFGGIADEVARFADGLRSLRGLLVDYGTRDEYAWIPKGCEHLAAQLDLHDIPFRLERFEGGHGPISARVADVMWPFFADTLVTS